MEDGSLLNAKGVSKRFAGVQALESVSFILKRATVHALCGENGAGKSTFMKILMGIHRKDSGEILYKGKPVDFTAPRQALHAGISIIEQELQPVLEMSVAENIFLGREDTKNRVFIDYRKLNLKTAELLAQLNVDIDPQRKMKYLSLAQVQLVEIAKAISYDSDIIIMDEPTSAIGEKETEKLFEVIRLLKSKGKGIIYISHRMKEIFTIADEITVFRDGKYIATVNRTEIDRPGLINLMIGRKLDEEYIKTNVPSPDDVLTVRSYSRKKKFENISFSVRKGEILGIFGIMGSGRSEFLDSLFGNEKPDHGELLIQNKQVRIRSPRDAMKTGMALVTEDRKTSGLLLNASVRDNVSLPSLRALTRLLCIDRWQEMKQVENAVKFLDIRTPTVHQLVKNLSGGNQQKVVFGKWVVTRPKILLLDEPTRGIDVGAKREIYKFMSEFASQGNVVIMISSELPEVLGMSDRIIVFKNGRIVGELNRDEATQDILMHLAS